MNYFVMSSEVETSLISSIRCVELDLLAASTFQRLHRLHRSRAAHVGTGASIDLDGFAFFDEERDINGFTGVDIPNDSLNERPQISRSAMMHFEHNGSVAIVFNRHSFSEIVCRGHLVR